MEVLTLKKQRNFGNIEKTRAGCKDVWNAYMCADASFDRGNWDIPLCPTTAQEIPNEIITWEEAKSIYKKMLARGEKEFKHNAFVCFYLDDYKFDGTRGVWHNSVGCLKILRHFAGSITPDFSTYQDFPAAIKIYNTYRMRVFGYWLGKNGIKVINNIRWGSEETFGYCFSGIPMNSMIAIGTVGGSPRKRIDRERFEKGLEELVRVLKPHTILVYGSANYPCFEKLREQGIAIVSYQSKTAAYFDRRRLV